MWIFIQIYIFTAYQISGWSFLHFIDIQTSREQCFRINLPPTDKAYLLSASSLLPMIQVKCNRDLIICRVIMLCERPLGGTRDNHIGEIPLKESKLETVANL